MLRTARFATGAAVLGFVGFAGAPGALAQSAPVCAAYSESCVKSEVVVNPPESGGTGGTGTAGNGTGPATGGQGSGVAGTVSSRSSTPATLPFTGGDVVLVGLAGAGAIATGTVLIVAARRRGATPA